MTLFLGHLFFFLMCKLANHLLRVYIGNVEILFNIQLIYNSLIFI